MRNVKCHRTIGLTVEPFTPFFWFKQAIEQEQPPSAKPLQGQLETDVLIVGGGYTGCGRPSYSKSRHQKNRLPSLKRGYAAAEPRAQMEAVC